MVSGIGGIGGADLSRLAQLYRQQVLSGTAATAEAGATGATGTTGTTGTASGGLPTTPVDPSAAARGSDFASAVGNGLSDVESLDRSAATKATRAATGDLKDVQDYVITAIQAQTSTELTTTVRNKALDAFNEIMRMPL